MSTVIPSVLLRNDVRMPQLGRAYTLPLRSLFSLQSMTIVSYFCVRIRHRAHTSQHESYEAEFVMHERFDEAVAGHGYDMQMVERNLEMKQSTAGQV